MQESVGEWTESDLHTEPPPEGQTPLRPKFRLIATDSPDRPGVPSMAASRRTTTIVGLLLILPAWLLPLSRWGRAYSGLGGLLGNESFWWAAVVIILLYVGVVERRPFSS